MLISVCFRQLKSTGVSFSKLRDKLEKTLEFKKGFILDAKEFSDVKSWALSFSIFKLKK